MRKTYITPRVGIILVECDRSILKMTEDPTKAPVISDGELDANGTTFDHIDLWEDKEEME